MMGSRLFIVVGMLATLGLSGCKDLTFNRDLLGYLEYWTDRVRVTAADWRASPESQTDLSGRSTVATNATITASLTIANPKGYPLESVVSLAASGPHSVEVSGPSASAVLGLTKVAATPTSLRVEVAPVSQVSTPASLSLEHTDFTVKLSPTRSDNAMQSSNPLTLTLRYNTPPRMPVEVAWSSMERKLGWLGEEHTDGWKIVQTVGNGLDNHIYWAWPKDKTSAGGCRPTDPDCVEEFHVYVNGTLIKTVKAGEVAGVAANLVSPRLADYNVYRAPANSGDKIEIYALDGEGVRSYGAVSGKAPHKITLKAGSGIFTSSGTTQVELYKAAGSFASGGDFESPYYNGHYLSGWTRDGIPVTFPLEMDVPMELVAQWTPNPPAGSGSVPSGGMGAGGGAGGSSVTTYTITYDKNNADGGRSPASQTKVAGKPLTLQDNSGNLTRTGYTFSGWNTQADGGGTNYASGTAYTADASVTLYAKWTANTYTVKFEGNGSNGGNMSDQTFIYDQSQKLTKNGYTRTGYTFAGWSTQATGGGTSYTDGQSVSNLTAINGETITLYAQWGESVRDFTELQRLANSSSSTPVTIVLTSDIDFNASNSNSSSYALEIPSGANVTLRGDGQQRTLQGSSLGWIEVKNGATLTLGPDLVIDGSGIGVSSHWGAVNVDGGTLIMEDGAMIKDLTFGGSVYGAVNVSTGGTFIMNGGEISGNQSNGDAAGVTVSTGGTFIMRGGEITGNKAVGGDGIGAAGNYFYYGGGLYISTGGSFTMDGGTISGNYEGGGTSPSDVTVENGATFTHNGGTIGQPVEHIP